MFKEFVGMEMENSRLPMIDVYSWDTPNGQKVHIMLEECGLPYKLHAVDISVGEQFDADFLKISPNNKIPALVDSHVSNGEPISIFESGAILIYLADKTGRFMPPSGAGRYNVLQWLMFQVGGVGPMFGQAAHFIVYAPEKVPYGIERYSKEAQRFCEVMNKQLMTSPYIAGAKYSIADIAIFPWVRALGKIGMDIKDYTYLANWFDSICIRPAVVKGLDAFKSMKVN